MRIDTNSEAAELNNGRATRTKAQPPPTKQDEAALSGAEKLTDTLAHLPEVRAQKVAQAREWVSDPAYPSAEVLGKVANVLARNFER